MIGDTGDGLYFQMMREGTNISDIRSRVLLGKAHIGDSGTSGQNAAATMDDRWRSAGCQTASARAPSVKAIADKKLFTLEDVRAHPRHRPPAARARPGRTDPRFDARRRLSPRPRKNRCAVHGLHARRGRSHPRAHLTGIRSYGKAPMESPDGCSTCRPALNYYLLSRGPAENERRLSVALHQRTCPCQHPERRHRIRHPAYLGRVTTRKDCARSPTSREFNVPDEDHGGQRIDLLA